MHTALSWQKSVALKWLLLLNYAVNNYQHNHIMIMVRYFSHFFYFVFLMFIYFIIFFIFFLFIVFIYFLYFYLFLCIYFHSLYFILLFSLPRVKFITVKGKYENKRKECLLKNVFFLFNFSICLCLKRTLDKKLCSLPI